MQVCFIGTPSIGFQSEDLEALRQHHDVTVPKRGGKAEILRAFKAAWNSDTVYAWFACNATAAAFLAARIRNRPRILVTGGEDTDMTWGPRRYRWTKRLAFRLATHVLPFSNEAAKKTVPHVDPTTIQIVACGIDTNTFSPHKRTPNETPMIAIFGLSEQNIHRKNPWSFATVSNNIPQATFRIYADINDTTKRHLYAIGGPNLEIHPRPDRPGYVAATHQADIVCQPSSHEGFGVSLMEAIATGATPVIPETGIAATDYIHEHVITHGPDNGSLTTAIRQALAHRDDKTRQNAAWTTINDRCDQEQRQRHIRRILEATQ